MSLLNRISIASLLVISLFISACKKESAETGKKTQDTETVAVNTVKVIKGSLTISKVLAANIEGGEQANVMAKIPERIVSLQVKIGDMVKAGQLVATLDKSGASSQYYQAEAAYKNTLKDFDRMKALLKEGAISQQMYDGVETQLSIAKANFEAAKSVVELTAPISGVVTALNGRIGDNANPAMPLMIIAQTSTLKAIFNVGEADIAAFTIGKSVLVYSDVKPDLSVSAKVFQISKSADMQSRSFEVKASFSNPTGSVFHPGMFCKVKADLQTRSNILTIPVIAQTTKGQETLAYAALNGKAEQRVIKTGLSDGDKIEVIGGLMENEEIITTGITDVQQGTPIRIENK